MRGGIVKRCRRGSKPAHEDAAVRVRVPWPADEDPTCYEWRDWRNGYFLWIQSVDVLPAHRDGGVFRALFGQVTGLARNDPRTCGIRLYGDRCNDRAQGVYARLGMHRSNYAIMETVYRGPESREDARPC